MNVGELKKILKHFPDEMEVVSDRYSDYMILDAAGVRTITGVSTNGWIMQSHPTMSEANKAREKTYLLLES